MQGEGMSVASDLRDGYDDSWRWLLQEGLMLCLFENLTGTETAAVQTEAQSGMIFGEKSNNRFMSSEKASHSLATSPVNFLSTQCSGPIYLTLLNQVGSCFQSKMKTD